MQLPNQPTLDDILLQNKDSLLEESSPKDLSIKLSIDNNDTIENEEPEWIEDAAETSFKPILLLPCPWKCELTNDRGYVLYSALGSFYIPMFVMLFFYWRIYRAAVRTTRAINQGFKTTKGRIIIYFSFLFSRTI